MGLPIGLLWLAIASLINTYIIIWGLDNAEVTSFGLQGTSLFFLEVIRLPVTYLERFIAYITGSE